MKYDRRKDFSKKKWKEIQKKKRILENFNLGTRDMKSEKYPSRAKQKMIDRKAVDNYE